MSDISQEVIVSVAPVTTPLMPSLGGIMPLETTKLRLPGGVNIAPAPQEAPTSDCTVIINNLLPSLSIALGPLGFLFCLLNVALKLKDCMVAVPDCISQLSPSPLVSALQGLAQAVVCLAKLIPQLSMLLLIYDILTVVIAMLSCISSAISSIIKIQGELTSALSASAKDQALTSQLQAAQAQAQVMGAQTVASLNPLTAVFAVLNLFLPLFGCSQVHDLDAPIPQASPLTEVLVVLDGLTTTLGGIRTTLGAIINP